MSESTDTPVAVAPDEPDEPDDLADPPHEFAFLEEVATEHGIASDGPPRVKRNWINAPSGGHLSALEWGRPPRRIVLLHGSAQNAHTWDATLLALGRPAVAIDLPGHGASSWRGDLRYGPADLAPAVGDGVDSWARGARVVVGFSLGGLTALALAARRPDLVPALVLVDITPGALAEGGARPSPLPALVHAPEGFGSRTELLERARRAWPARSSASLRRGIIHNTTRRDDGRWVWRHHFGSLPERPTVDVDVERLWSAVGRVPGPVVLVRALGSPVVRAADVAELRRRRPDVEVHELAGVSHDVPGEAPVLLADVVDDLAELVEVHA